MALNSIIEAEVETAVIFGKTWKLHVDKVLNLSIKDNIRIIEESISYLKDKGLKVIFDAEHYFDGYKSDPEYAIDVINAAYSSGAEISVLCDTNGGTLTKELQQIVRETVKKTKGKKGIHTHDDSGLAVANTIISINEGVRHIQGTINGLGERCGNADLCQILPNLNFKTKFNTLISNKPKEEQLEDLTSLSQYVYQLTNLSGRFNQPYVGRNAFTHKGGIHVDALLKTPKTYEHLDPKLVGNRRTLSVSELSGRASIVKIAEDLNLKILKRGDLANKVLRKIKNLESQGYHFENAQASVNLILLREAKLLGETFTIKSWKVTSGFDKKLSCRAEVFVEMFNDEYHEFADGVGPVHALDQSFKNAVMRRFPKLSNTNLINYKVTVIDSEMGTASVVRVFIEFEDDAHRWATTAVSSNVLEASTKALADGYTYKLAIDKLRIA